MFREPSESWPDHATVEALIAGPDSTILVVEEDTAVAGFITLLMCRRPQTPIRPSRTYVEVDNMAVDPSKRRRGIGRVLMDAATVWATQHGASRLELNVYEFNEAASRLYGSTGFVTVSRRLSREIPRPTQK
jgi:diamine N-acetyltransferase